MAKNREYLLFSDAVMSNPNGDMINDNKPRQDQRTNQLEMSDVRIKRYARDEFINMEENVFVKPVIDDKGKHLDCKKIADSIVKTNSLKGNDLERYLKDNYIDVKLFGAVVTSPKFNIHGPLQIMWSKSVHEAEVRYEQGTSAFSSGDNKSQGTTWSKYFTPYALFRTYMTYNDDTAKRQEISITEEELDKFRTALLNGIRNYKSTSKNQMPRLLIEVIYNEKYLDGELDYVDIEYLKDDYSLNNIKDFKFNLEPLIEYKERLKDKISEIKIFAHRNVNLVNHEGFEIVTI